jgi:hypothetical protein
VVDDVEAVLDLFGKLNISVGADQSARGVRKLPLARSISSLFADGKEVVSHVRERSTLLDLTPSMMKSPFFVALTDQLSPIVTGMGLAKVTTLLKSTRP